MDLADSKNVFGPEDVEAEEPAFLEALRQREGQAYEALFLRYGPNLIRTAATYLGGTGLAEEAVQEALLAVYQNIETFEGRSRLKTWVFRILINRAMKTAIRERRVVSFSDVAASSDDHAAWLAGEGLDVKSGAWASPPVSWDPERLALSEELRGILVEAIEALPESQRLVVMLRDVEGFDSREAAELLELSEANQRVLLHRGRARVRKALTWYLAEGVGR